MAAMDVMSPPARGRGLKRLPGDATIERMMSPPARGRGLKLRQPFCYFFDRRSPPARGRGLKQLLRMELHEYKRVAPRAGAWIETI